MELVPGEGEGVPRRDGQARARGVREAPRDRDNLGRRGGRLSGGGDRLGRRRRGRSGARAVAAGRGRDDEGDGQEEAEEVGGFGELFFFVCEVFIYSERWRGVERENKKDMKKKGSKEKLRRPG